MKNLTITHRTLRTLPSIAPLKTDTSPSSSAPHIHPPRPPRTPWQNLLHTARTFGKAGLPMAGRPDRRHRYALCHTCKHNRAVHHEQPRTPAYNIDCARRPCGACQGIQPWLQRARCPASKW